MKNIIRFGAGLTLIAAAGCSDYLSCAECVTSPTAPTTATSTQRLVATQAKLWQLVNGELARESAMFMQQMAGTANQYQTIDRYSLDPNGDFTTPYTGGGLVDLLKVESDARASGDKTMLGISLVFKAWLMSVSADFWGDMPYTQAAQPDKYPTPVYDPQQVVYDSLQNALSDAITALNANAGAGPSAAELVYKGDRSKWIALAHTLKARFYMHTAEVRPEAYAQALAEAKQGIMSDAGNFEGRFNTSSGQQNFYYQFEVTAGRSGYVVPNQGFIQLLESRNDPRRAEYFNAKGTDLSATRKAPDFQQPYVSYDENTLIWAEAAYRTGDQVTALQKLNEERANHGLPAEAVAGQALLREILTEEYIADFQLGFEAFSLYNRTCFPNLVPTGSKGGPIPARLYYDASERQTDTSIPEPGVAPNTLRNRDNPPNAVSDGTGAACLGQ